MNARGLTECQRHQLLVAACDRRDWYKRLRERMDAAGWDADCPAYRAAVAAHDAAHALVRAVYDASPPPALTPAIKPMDRSPDPVPPREPDVPWVGKPRGRRRHR